MDRNDVSGTSIDRYLRVIDSGDAVVEIIPPTLPRCPECGKPVGYEPCLMVVGSERYPAGEMVHWDCYNNERI